METEPTPIRSARNHTYADRVAGTELRCSAARRIGGLPSADMAESRMTVAGTEQPAADRASMTSGKRGDGTVRSVVSLNAAAVAVRPGRCGGAPRHDRCGPGRPAPEPRLSRREPKILSMLLRDARTAWSFHLLFDRSAFSTEFSMSSAAADDLRGDEHQQGRDLSLLPRRCRLNRWPSSGMSPSRGRLGDGLASPSFVFRPPSTAVCPLLQQHGGRQGARRHARQCDRATTGLGAAADRRTRRSRQERSSSWRRCPSAPCAAASTCMITFSVPGTM